MGVSLVHERLFGRRSGMPAVAPTAAAVVVLVLLLAACGSGDDGAGAATSSCEPVRTEALDPDSAQHVLPNAPEPSYLSDPPTSGPHQPGPARSGVVDEPLPSPVQVGLLEAGQVLIQHAEPLDRAQADELAAIDPAVAVVPNPELRSPIVATAWRHKLECFRVELADLRNFVETYAGRGAGNH